MKLAEQMGTFRAAGVLVVALVQTAMAAPQLESVTFHTELVDRLEDMTIQGTVYFSTKHEAYRYDFNGGQNKVFIYPKKQIAYYYYPTSDFREMKFSFTLCEYFPIPYQQELLNPIPSVDGYTYVGPDYVYDTNVEKYIRGSPDGDPAVTMWVEKVDNKTGIRQRPVRLDVKEWSKQDGIPRDFPIFHQVIEYFKFSIGEQDPSIWDRPQIECLDAVVRDDVGIISGTLRDFRVPKKLLLMKNAHNNPKVERKYARGRKNTTLTNDEDDKTGLLLPFPYEPEEVASVVNTLPREFDWRNHGAVTPVKDQRACGSCWAFGTVGSLEGAYFLKTGSLVSISEQALVDCAGYEPRSGFNNGCFGGRELNGFAWIEQNGGIPPTADYPPYQEANGNCRITSQTKLIAQLAGFHHIPSDTDSVKTALVKHGPLTVSVNTTHWDHYTNGILTCGKCDATTKIDHTVVLVGYGESADHEPYWIVKNSWANAWGMDGYILLSGKGNCNCILQEAYLPVLK